MAIVEQELPYEIERNITVDTCEDEGDIERSPLFDHRQPGRESMEHRKDQPEKTAGLFWDGRHRANTAEYDAVGYTGYGAGFNRASYRIRLNAARRILGRNCRSVEKVLEAAAGIGAYFPLWKSFGASTWVGLDISPTAVESLRNKFPDERFELCDISAAADMNAALREETFDLTTAIDVLYHIVDDAPFQSALANLAQRLKPGGALLVSDVFVKERNRIAPHVCRRPMSAYENVLNPLGFELVDREAVFAVLGDPVASGSSAIDFLLFNSWRVIGKIPRSAPMSLQNTLGAAVVYAATPLDGLLRSAGLAKGRNLELAMFRRKI